MKKSKTDYLNKIFVKKGKFYKVFEVNMQTEILSRNLTNNINIMEDKMTEKEAYMILQKKSGLKVGDTVKVLRKAKDYEWGWSLEWNDRYMDMFIGKDFIIEDVSNLGIKVIYEIDDNKYWFLPFFVLEKIADAKPKDPIIDFIEKNDFGCLDQKRLTKELVQMILDRIGEKTGWTNETH